VDCTTHLSTQRSRLQLSGHVLPYVGSSSISNIANKSDDYLSNPSKQLGRLHKDCASRCSALTDGPLRLECDDFRPADVLLGPDNDVAAVIDWNSQNKYAAPTHFILGPRLFATPDWDALSTQPIRLRIQPRANSMERSESENDGLGHQSHIQA